MTTGFADFLHQRLEQGGFTTEDALASFLPLLAQTAAAHRAGQVAPLEGVGELHVEGVKTWFEDGKRRPPRLQPARIKELQQTASKAIAVVGEARLDAEVDEGHTTVASLDIGRRGEPLTRPVYLPGYVSWEHEAGHHDPLTDIYCLGLVLASLACGLDLNDPEALGQFVQARRNLFDINASLHPVLAKAIVRMTELERQRRPQDAAVLLHALENYRDQDIDFDFDLARIAELKTAPPQGKRGLILSRLQQRLFEISRRNRLLHFRQTQQTVNLTWSSVPLSFNVESIRPEQILTWNADFQKAVVSGKPISLNRYLRFEEAVYLPSLLDQIRNEARRDKAEFGFTQLRLAVCFLRWANLKEKPPERFDSPLVLLPVELVKTKGVRDTYTLNVLDTEAEINPILRHCLKQLYNVDLPENIDLENDSLDKLFDQLAARVQSSEPAVNIEKIDKPRIQLIHARAKRRLDQYRRRVRLSGRGVHSFQDLDYSYDRENFHPLGLRLFQTRVKPRDNQLHALLADAPRPRSYMTPNEDTPGLSTQQSEPLGPDAAAAIAEKERLLYVPPAEETNPYRWEFDLCSVTLGHFRYRKMSLVRDYGLLLEKDVPHAGFDQIFSLEPKPVDAVRPTPPPLAESFPIVACDPTQASAIMLARTGRDFIIQGPPGTGKSQTITNLIADNIRLGKRVLFVCEKRAAIDVVFHRLKQSGLDSLCSLIHDSQADKKEFVMDLKKTYEGYLDTQDRKSHADEERKKLLATLNDDLAPLTRFHDAMRSTLTGVGIPLRRLLCRAVELREQAKPLSAEEKERLPSYGLWTAHDKRMLALAAQLEEAFGSPILAKHPLHLLTTRLANTERPIETLRKRLDDLLAQMDKVANLVAQASALARGAAAASIEDLRQIANHAVRLRFLAERKLLALLQPNSEPAKRLLDFAKKHATIRRDLERAQLANKNWKHKLPPGETKTALEQARQLEPSFFRFLRPAWWRLRGVMQRSYHFLAHSVRPSWSEVLRQLQEEHDIQASLDEVEAEARETFRHEGDFPEFGRRLDEAATASSNLPAVAKSLYQQLAQHSSGDEAALRWAELQSVLEDVIKRLPDILETNLAVTLTNLRKEVDRIDGASDDLPDFLPILKELAALPSELATALRHWPEAAPALEAALAGRGIEDVFRADRALARLDGTVRTRHVERLERNYQQFFAANAAVVRDGVRGRFLEHVRISNQPHGQLTAEQKEFKTIYNKGRRELEHEFGKTMRYKSIRDLVGGNSGLVIRDLKPVWLMSPLSVSDTLPLDTAFFDVVIFDEASQVTLEEAIPSLFRARQALVVGDEMQLPPTNFFSAKQTDEDEALLLEDDTGGRVEYDLSGNSFLNHAARNLPSTMLGWHYRSRSESLISFSNAAFYQGRLLTVPDASLPPPSLTEIRVATPDDGAANAARLLDRPVSFHFLEKGVYQQRCNPAEAGYIAHLVRQLLMSDQGLSIGIVAFSEAQQEEIQDALDRLARSDDAFQSRYEAELEREVDGQFVGLLIKNLENIQGDERDIVILSVCYGYGPSGKMLMNFGPINQNGGEKRLNVAFSRAKKHMALVASIPHHAITNDYNDGARCLKNYLRYAAASSSGDFASAVRVLREMTPHDKDNNEKQDIDAVCRELSEAMRAAGYDVDENIGQSSFRCDLAVRRAGDKTYRAAILVDTDSYYQNVDLLEREVLRPQLLRAFGWKVLHVLTKDWHAKRNEVVKELIQVLK